MKYCLWSLLCSVLSAVAHGNEFYDVKNMDIGGLHPQKLLSRAFANVFAGNKLPNISNGCLTQITSPKFLGSIKQYLDAVGKPHGGILLGNMYWPGSVEECKGLLDTHYCLSFVTVPIKTQKITLKVGLCSPSACSVGDILLMIDFGKGILNITSGKESNSTAGKSQLSLVCQDNMRTWSAGTVGVVTLCGLIICLCLIGTVIELYQEATSVNESPCNKTTEFMPILKDSTLPSLEGDKIGDSESEPLVHSVIAKKSRVRSLAKYLSCFSLIKNTNIVLDTNVPSGAITSLHGIRVLSMWWIILGHVLSFAANDLVIDNAKVALNVVRRFTFLPLANGYFAVDTFFLLSGLLVAYVSFRRLSTKGTLPLLPFYVHRFLRLTPVYLFLILFITYVVPLLADGPVWKIATQGQIQACKDNWWTNILYINNFYPTELSKTCINWTWYLADDMQFYIVSPLFLYAIYKLRFPGAFLSLGSVLTTSLIVTGILYRYYNFTPFPTSDLTRPDFDGREMLICIAGQSNKTLQERYRPRRARENDMFMRIVYVKPYCRIPPYLVGIFTGYLLHKKKTFQGKFKWVFVLLGWAVAIALGMMLTYGTWPYFKDGRIVPSHTVKVLVGTFSRFLWGVAVAWVAYACHVGYGGLINRILSWRALIPLSRLTYGVYMVHLIVVFLVYFGRETPMHFTDVTMAIYFVATVALSYGTAFLLAVCVEMPIANLEKLLFKF